jgi:hypothetical protein
VSHLNWFSAYWLGWILAFLIPELWALWAGRPQDTLSETVWSVENLNLNQPFDFAMWTDVHWAIAILVWALFLWLSLHFPFGLMR